MKILLKNVSNTYNYGSMMMAENLISFLTKKNNNIEFFIEALDLSDLQRLRIATRYNKIYKDSKLHINLITKNIKYVRVIERLIRRKKHVKNAAKYYDAIIILGGDDFSEIYYKFPKDNFELKFVFEELQIFKTFSKLYMVGQTIGPYTGKRIGWAKKAFQNIKIYTRDDETTSYMKNTFNIDTKTSRDLAFLDLNLQGEYNSKVNKILHEYGLSKNKYVIVVGTGLISKYCDNKDDMIDAFYKLLLKLNKDNEKVVCLTHVFTPDGINDSNLYKMIDKKYDNYLSKNCIVIDKPILPVEARIILGNGKYTITCRMHAAVSTFQMGNPAICFAYSKKYKGVISDGLDLPELVIDVKQDKFWKNKFNNLVNKKIRLLNEDKNIKRKIKSNVKKCKENVLDMLEDLYKDLIK